MARGGGDPGRTRRRGRGGRAAGGVPRAADRLARRPWLGSALLAVATWIKVWPAALVGAALIALHRRWVVAASAAIVTVLVVVLVAAAGGGQYVFGFVGDQTTRSLQIESPVSSMRRSSASNGPSTTLRSRPEGLACTLRSARADVHGVGCERGRRNDSTGVDPGRTILL
ncbi:hypothetical protein CJ026_026555 [Ralstonia pickettii]|uniref:glycosyltransferase 87 family protein n=1 Tax=Ralstonia pickettii TaxID=329 RepID=UPI000CD4ECB0|nr:hypothetical protein CJ026_026555 [Ralstonia pickettii]